MRHCVAVTVSTGDPCSMGRNPGEELSLGVLPLCWRHRKMLREELSRAGAVAKWEADELREENFLLNLALQDERQNSEKLRKLLELRKPRPTRDLDTNREVYFLRAGDQVKIGSAGNVSKRVARIVKVGGVQMPPGIDLSRAEVLRTEAGGLSREHELHRKFAGLRTVGEWFRFEGELEAYCADQ